MCCNDCNQILQTIRRPTVQLFALYCDVKDDCIKLLLASVATAVRVVILSVIPEQEVTSCRHLSLMERKKSWSEMKKFYCSSSLLLAAMLPIAKVIVRTVFFCNLTVKHSSDSSHPCFSLCSCYKLTKPRKLWGSCKTSCSTHTQAVCQRKCGFVLTLTHLSVFPLVPLYPNALG